ncbi:MAG: tetratricopeptide repeat protein, partial [Candidatus Acidiferrum sp.]
ILHDPINILEANAVPILVAIDERGIVRSTRPVLATFQTDFLDKIFTDVANGDHASRIGPAVNKDTRNPDWDAVRTRAKTVGDAPAWRELGDACALWGGIARLEEALDAYNHAVKLDPKDGAAWFRLGACFRRRSESMLHRTGDFQAAIDCWSRALDIDPNQYIWRRRIQQYGPRLDKPYSFYDWVDVAEKDIRARGAAPLPLAVRPGGAEIAQPLKTLPASAEAVRNPDPDGRVNRDKERLIRAEVTVAPARIRPGQAVRIHVDFRLNPAKQAHWNNEAESLRMWVKPPEGWQVSDRLLTAPAAREPVSGEMRELDIEIKAPKEARDKVCIGAYALYNICDDKGGQCRFLRLDVPIQVLVSSADKAIK